MTDQFSLVQARYRKRNCALSIDGLWHATFKNQPVPRAWLKNSLYETPVVCGTIIVDGSTGREPNCPKCREKLADRYHKGVGTLRQASSKKINFGLTKKDQGSPA